jgi:3-oxoadipate CoA-transferase alpha subunit
MVGGWLLGPRLRPHNFLHALVEQGTKNLVIITESVTPTIELSKRSFPPDGFIATSTLFEKKQVRKVIAGYAITPYAHEPTTFEKLYDAGEIEFEPVPYGTLAERIRAGGAGIGGFYTRTSVGTYLEKGKEKRVFNGMEYVLEMPLKADFALLKAYKADKMGNLVYRKTTRNINPVMATAANVTMAEVDEIVEPGELDPETIVTPGIYVDRIVKVPSIPWSLKWGTRQVLRFR